MVEKDSLMVNLITLHMQHHAKSSGYDHLCDYIDANVISSVNKWSFNKRVITRLLRFATRRSGQTWYQRGNLYCELQAARQWSRSSGQIFHFLYGENSYRYLGNLKAFGRRNSIICTYHIIVKESDYDKIWFELLAETFQQHPLGLWKELRSTCLYDLHTWMGSRASVESLFKEI